MTTNEEIDVEDEPSKADIEAMETDEEAREWVALLSDNGKARAWAKEQARSMVARYPDRDPKKELAKWLAIADAGVEGSGIDTEGLFD